MREEAKYTKNMDPPPPHNAKVRIFSRFAPAKIVQAVDKAMLLKNKTYRSILAYITLYEISKFLVHIYDLHRSKTFY